MGDERCWLGKVDAKLFWWDRAYLSFRIGITISFLKNVAAIHRLMNLTNKVLPVRHFMDSARLIPALLSTSYYAYLLR